MHKGFVYERVPHIRLETIARNPDIKPGMSQKEIDATIKRHAEIHSCMIGHMRTKEKFGYQDRLQ